MELEDDKRKYHNTNKDPQAKEQMHTTVYKRNPATMTDIARAPGNVGHKAALHCLEAGNGFNRHYLLGAATL